MKKLFAVVVLMMLVWHHAFSLDLNITLSNAGDLINQVDVSKLDEVESLTIAGDLNGTDILVIRKMVNLQTLDMTNANIVNGGNSYYENYITSENEIGAYFFKDITHLVNVSLPNSVYKIGKKVFSGCEMLESVSIGNSTEIIEESVFEKCKKLGEIIIPQSVKAIGDFVFEGCTSLENVIMSDGNEILELGQYGSHYLSWRDHEGLFYDCPLKSVYLGRNVSYIENTRYGEPNSPFSDHSELETIIVSESVSILPANLFFECDAITAVELPNSVKKIGSGVFGCCDGIISIVIPQSVSLIKGQAFWKCSNLKTITIEGSPKIEADILEGCYNFETINILSLSSWLKIEFDSKNHSPYGVPYDLYLNGKLVNEIEIPADISIIHECAFYDCNSIETVAVPSTVETINENPFAASPNLKKLVIEDGENDLEWIRLSWAFTNSLEYLYLGRNISWLGKDVIPFSGTNLKELWIGDFVNRIADKAFGCKYLEYVHIGKGVIKIGREAFKGCINLKAVYISDMSQWLNFTFLNTTDNPLYYSKHLFLNDIEVSNLIVPDGITKISDNAFINCSTLESITFSCTTLQSIGMNAFSSCDNLKAVELPNCVSSIEAGAFNGCKSMTLVVIGKNVVSIGGNAFKDCESLEKVYSLNTTPPAISESTFGESTEKNATLYVPNDCKNIYWLHPYWENFMKIEEIEAKEDISEKQALALKSYQDGVSIYDGYVYYYKGDGHIFYQATIGKQRDNNKVADDIFTDIERLRKQISESSMSDDEKASYNKTLDEIDNAVCVLQKYNESGYYINFNDRVEKNYIPFSDYYSRLEQYKERIDAATTNEELDAIIAEIDADAAGMTDYYLNPIIDDYNEMVRISQRFTEIGEELSKYQTKLSGIAKDIETSISGIEQVLLSDGDVIVVNLRGERLTMKSSQIKTLPKGIYIVNGSKYVVK